MKTYNISCEKEKTILINIQLQNKKIFLNPINFFIGRNFICNYILLKWMEQSRSIAKKILSKRKLFRVICSSLEVAIVSSTNIFILTSSTREHKKTTKIFFHPLRRTQIERIGWGSSVLHFLDGAPLNNQPSQRMK